MSYSIFGYLTICNAVFKSILGDIQLFCAEVSCGNRSRGSLIFGLSGICVSNIIYITL